jgi:polyhydroxyalkanoate synthesis regulator phasin
MSNEELYQKAENAIEELFSDTSVTPQKCAENMQELRDRIDEYVESLESELARYR